MAIKNKDTVTVNYTVNFFALFGTVYSFLHGPGKSKRLLYLFLIKITRTQCVDIPKQLNHYNEIYNKDTLACTKERSCMEVSEVGKTEDI
jgi:hypothetical protein